MKTVKITKLSSTDTPVCETPLMKDYSMGKDNGNVSLPTEYWLEGVLMQDIVVGTPISVYRTIRNGVETPGIFTSSNVMSITENVNILIVKTQNSIYQVEEI